MINPQSGYFGHGAHRGTVIRQDIYKSTPIHRTNIYPQKVIQQQVYSEQTNQPKNDENNDEKMLYWFIIILILIGIGIYIPKLIGQRRY